MNCLRKCSNTASFLVATLLALATGATAAGNLTVLHYFGSNDTGGNQTLILSSNVLYATGDRGICSIRTDGTCYTNLHAFPETNGPYQGVIPSALTVAGNMLYGTTEFDGSNYEGTVFALQPDGTGFTNLHVFSALNPPGTNSDGVVPEASLTLYNGALYGTTASGGAFGSGTVFALNTDGTGFTNVYAFSAVPSPDYTNSDGASPLTPVIMYGDALYGTTSRGGSMDGGTIFALVPDGNGFTNLHNFLEVRFEDSIGLTLYDNTFYGFTDSNLSGGLVFKLEPDGTGFTNIVAVDFAPGFTIRGGIIYGIAYKEAGGGIYSVNTDGTGLTNLYTFSTPSGEFETNSDGALPVGIPVLSGNILYGVTAMGGTNGYGVIYALTLPSPTLNIQFDSTNAILSWADGTFSLQSASNAAGPYSTITNATSPYPILPIAARQFFRLQAQWNH